MQSKSSFVIGHMTGKIVSLKFPLSISQEKLLLIMRYTIFRNAHTIYASFV